MPAAIMQPAIPATPAAVGSPAHVAMIANAAAIALPAQTGAVARVAQPGSPALPASIARPAVPARPATPARVATSAPFDAHALTETTSTDSAPATTGRATPGETGVGVGSVSNHEASSDFLGEQASPFQAAPMSNAAGTTTRGAPSGVDVAGRVERLLALHDAVAATPASHVLLELDEQTGAAGRIRIDLRGHEIGASFDMQCADAAAEVRTRLHELARALERSGLDTGQMRVTTSQPVETATTRVATAAVSQAATDSGAQTGAGSDRRNEQDPANAERNAGRQQSDPERRRSGRQSQKEN
jgi:hypothetical protein